MAEEQFCYEKIDQLMRAYQDAIKPYVDRLVAIQRKPLPPVYLTVGEAHKWFLHQIKEDPWDTGQLGRDPDHAQLAVGSKEEVADWLYQDPEGKIPAREAGHMISEEKPK